MCGCYCRRGGTPLCSLSERRIYKAIPNISASMDRLKQRGIDDESHGDRWDDCDPEDFGPSASLASAVNGLAHAFPAGAATSHGMQPGDRKSTRITPGALLAAFGL